MKALRSFVVVVIATLSLFPAACQAQWVAGSLTVDRVDYSSNNYTYSANSGTGYVSAISPTYGESTISVRFAQVWTNTGNSDTIGLICNCHLTGSSTGPSTGSGCDDTTAGFYGKSISGTNSYDNSKTFPSLPAASPTTVTGYFTLTARANGAGSSMQSTADASGWFTN